jgi:hypothetical protein
MFAGLQAFPMAKGPSLAKNSNRGELVPDL